MYSLVLFQFKLSHFTFLDSNLVLAQKFDILRVLGFIHLLRKHTEWAILVHLLKQEKTKYSGL